MFERIIKDVILKNFFSLDLSSNEREIAEESVSDKYVVALKKAVFYSILGIFPIVFLETQILVGVLIPLTMVTGTAWFSISLANVKQKFEHFGLELTTDLFEAFSISLGLLFMLGVFSLGSVFLDSTRDIPFENIFQIVSLFIGIGIIWEIIYKIFIGSIKYDINDAMLAGQNEAAEMYFRKALSTLNSVSESLRSGKSLQVANYYIGIAFFEIFSSIENSTLNTQELKEKANILIKTPSIEQEEADTISIELIQEFLNQILPEYSSDSSIEVIRDEIGYIQSNQDESQEMTDTRFSIIFDKIGLLVDQYGETLFKKH